MLVSAAVTLLLIVGAVAVYRALPAPQRPVYVITELQTEIRSYAEANGLEPAYVAAVVMAESSYDPSAVSSANAQGLMQLLPETGADMAGKFREEYTEGCLLDPDTNLRYGCRYLGWLMQRYDDDMSCASSAYHAGFGNVDKWLKDPALSSDGRTLDSIPSSVTRTYVERVLRYYERYKEIYA